MSGKIGFFKALGLIGTVASEVNDAYEDDQKITADEVIGIGSVILSNLDIELDTENQVYLDLALDIVDWMKDAGKDKKITIAEIVDLLEDASKILGYDFDKTGYQF